MEQLNCKRTVLHPGDALFLPRRIVHSACVSSCLFSAHLTFGFNVQVMCWDYATPTIAYAPTPSRQLQHRPTRPSPTPKDDAYRPIHNTINRNFIHFLIPVRQRRPKIWSSAGPSSWNVDTCWLGARRHATRSNIFRDRCWQIRFVELL